MTFLALAVPVGTASLAYACTALATLTITSGAAAPGQTIIGTGKGFNGGLHGADPATASRTPVVMRLDSRSGLILGSFTPSDISGNLAFSFAAPNVPAGQHVLIGVQTNPDTGNPYYGTPARQSITIAAAAARTDAARADGVSAPAAATDQAAPAPAAASTTPAPPAAATAASANVAARPTQAASAPSSGAAAASSAPVQAGQASVGAPAAPASGIQPTLASDLDAGSATPAAAAASAAAAATTTATPDLVSSSTPEGGSVLPAMLLMLLGLGLGLTASARWLLARLPMLRRTAAA